MIATSIVPGRKTYMFDVTIRPLRFLAPAVLALALSSLPLHGTPTQEERIPPHLLARANSEGAVRVIVRLRARARRKERFTRPQRSTNNEKELLEQAMI